MKIDPTVLSPSDAEAIDAQASKFMKSGILWISGVWKSASRMVRQGVHVFRESLQEGVKVAQMLKEDVDDGVTQIWGKPGENTNSGDAQGNAAETKERSDGESSEGHGFKNSNDISGQQVNKH